MAWPPVCDRCGAELKEPGALVIGPPDADGRCEKLHVCAGLCWDMVRIQASIKKDLHSDPKIAVGSKDKCPVCQAPEVEAFTPRTVYSCGSSTYDNRPGTYRKGDGCPGSAEKVQYLPHPSVIDIAYDGLKAQVRTDADGTSKVFVRQHHLDAWLKTMDNGDPRAIWAAGLLRDYPGEMRPREWENGLPTYLED